MQRVLITTHISIAIALSCLLGSCSANPPSASTTPNPTQPDRGTVATLSTINSTDIEPAAAAIPTVAPLPNTQIAKKSVRVEFARRKLRNRASNIGADTCPSFPCLVLTSDPNNARNKFNNPIYKLTAYSNNSASPIFQLDAVTGRAFTQERDRYQSGTEAPLPDGYYSVAARVVNGTIREVGGTMIPIFPKSGFDRRVGRTALGIHWDPSFNKDKKEDGTSGCIGLTTRSDYIRLKQFVLKYRPRVLEVQIDT